MQGRLIEIKQKICKAFGCSFHPLNDDELEELAENLCVMDNKTLLEWLPQVLLNEISFGERQIPGGDFVIFFLDGACMKKQLDGTMYCNQIVQKYRLDFAERTFSSFTFLQAEAIYEWLINCAKLKYQDICGNEIPSAIYYWKNKKDVLGA